MLPAYYGAPVHFVSRRHKPPSSNVEFSRVWLTLPRCIDPYVQVFPSVLLWMNRHLVVVSLGERKKWAITLRHRQLGIGESSVSWESRQSDYICLSFFCKGAWRRANCATESPSNQSTLKAFPSTDEGKVAAIAVAVASRRILSKSDQEIVADNGKERLHSSASCALVFELSSLDKQGKSSNTWGLRSGCDSVPFSFSLSSILSFEQLQILVVFGLHSRAGLACQKAYILFLKKTQRNKKDKKTKEYRIGNIYRIWVRWKTGWEKTCKRESESGI